MDPNIWTRTNGLMSIEFRCRLLVLSSTYLSVLLLCRAEGLRSLKSSRTVLTAGG